MHPLESKISSILTDNDLVSTGSTVVVGVSCGPDSMALLHLLDAARSKISFSLVAVYVDHGLRPEETPDERERIREVAEKLSIPYEIVEVDVRAEAKTRKISIEHAARELRYRAFARVASRYEADITAVGHNADDQVEELLLRLLRGGSRKALSGMLRKTGTIIRPLLDFPKSVLLEYLADRGITYCQDSSNLESHYLRNRIRLKLLPLLEKEYDSGVRKALLKTVGNLREDEDLLSKLVKEAGEKAVVCREDKENAGGLSIRLDRNLFRTYHPAIQRRLVENLLWEIGSAARYEHILAVVKATVENKSGGELHLSRGLRAVIAREHVLFYYPRGKTGWRGSVKEQKE